MLAAGCAATGELPSSMPTASLADSSAADKDIEIAGEIDIRAHAQAQTGVMCRREAPLGSRISVERCHEVAPARESELQHLARQEIEQLRQQQMIEAQQRQALRGQARERMAQ
jgi:hypothetical protein